MTLDWKNLPFAYLKTDFNVRCYYRDGKWSGLEDSSTDYLNIHIASTCLHYGQEVFEGLKAFRGKDEKIRIFRMDENSKRMKYSANGVLMEPVPEELFKEAVIRVVQLNEKYVPPYGTGASLYIRPLLLGTGAEVGVKPTKEYTFIIFVTPVGPYFKEGFTPVDLMICRKYDRTAPLGTGAYKVGGNYASSLASLRVAHEAGFATALYLDAKEKKYIDEAGPANFIGIKKNTYITPNSKSILNSITNLSLMTLAKDMGMKIEKRPVSVTELDTFEEAAACGTAAVLTPVRKIVDPDENKIYEFCKDGKPGKVCEKLYYTLLGIQLGDIDDIHGWVTVLD